MHTVEETYSIKAWTYWQPEQLRFLKQVPRQSPAQCRRRHSSKEDSSRDRIRDDDDSRSGDGGVRVPERGDDGELQRPV